jgi:hypothetical protein
MQFPLCREASAQPEVPMRRLSLLAATFLPLLVPAAAHAGGCPAGDAGVVDKDSYRLGEVVDFFDSYHDFADPGTVTITFERTTDGATREFIAYNGPDGTWYRMVTFDSSADVGRWNVSVVVDQTDALDTCTDVVTILPRSGMPNTATVEPTMESSGTGDRSDGVVLAVLLLGGAVGAGSAVRHRALPGSRNP